jgi:hypothetical protein
LLLSRRKSYRFATLSLPASLSSPDLKQRHQVADAVYVIHSSLRRRPHEGHHIHNLLEDVVIKDHDVTKPIQPVELQAALLAALDDTPRVESPAVEDPRRPVSPASVVVWDMARTLDHLDGAQHSFAK